MPIQSTPVTIQSTINLSDINIDTDLDMGGNEILNLGTTTIATMKDESIFISPLSVLLQETISYPTETELTGSSYNKHLDIDLDVVFDLSFLTTQKLVLKAQCYHKTASGTGRIGFIKNDIIRWI